eukprot:128873-Pyramimonas_sp.AAC.1
MGRSKADFNGRKFRTTRPPGVPKVSKPYTNHCKHLTRGILTSGQRIQLGFHQTPNPILTTPDRR